jgi:hypothetical protein
LKTSHSPNNLLILTSIFIIIFLLDILFLFFSCEPLVCIIIIGRSIFHHTIN